MCFGGAIRDRLLSRRLRRTWLRRQRIRRAGWITRLAAARVCQCFRARSSRDAQFGHDTRYRRHPLCSVYLRMCRSRHRELSFQSWRATLLERFTGPDNQEFMLSFFRDPLLSVAFM
jgi:hypothetical protein